MRRCTVRADSEAVATNDVASRLQSRHPANREGIVTVRIHWLEVAQTRTARVLSSFHRLSLTVMPLYNAETHNWIQRFHRLACEADDWRRNDERWMFMGTAVTHDVLLIPPLASMYAGQQFGVEITVTETYPREPPRMRFLVPITHPNVLDSGEVVPECWQKDWRPGMGVCDALKMLVALLGAPDMEHAGNAGAVEPYALAREAWAKRMVARKAELEKEASPATSVGDGGAALGEGDEMSASLPEPSRTSMSSVAGRQALDLGVPTPSSDAEGGAVRKGPESKWRISGRRLWESAKLRGSWRAPDH